MNLNQSTILAMYEFMSQYLKVKRLVKIPVKAFTKFENENRYQV